MVSSDGVQTIPLTTRRFSTAAATGSSAGATRSTMGSQPWDLNHGISTMGSQPLDLNHGIRRLQHLEPHLNLKIQSFVLSSEPSSATLSASRVRLRVFHTLSLCGLSHLTNHFVARPAPSFLTILPRISTFDACFPNSCVAGPVAPVAPVLCRVFLLLLPSHRCSNPLPSRIA